MNILRKRGPHNVIHTGLGGSNLGHHSLSRRRTFHWADYIGFIAIAAFLVLGLVGFYFFLWHHHTMIIDVDAQDISKIQHVRKDTASLRPRFVTVVMPSVVNPKGQEKRLQAIADTWGEPSRAIFVVHDTSDYPCVKADIIGHDGSAGRENVYPKLLVVPPSISPEEGVPRLQHVIQTVSNVIDADFTFFVNDHTFVIPEHLCSFLSTYNPAQDLYAGHALRNDHLAFNSGAAGYVLSRTTMRRVVERWDQNDPNCSTGNLSKWLQGNPGLLTAQCLNNALHVHVMDTRDENRLHRFHAFGLVRTVSGKVDEWYLNKHKRLDQDFGEDEVYHHIPGTGRHCCSPETISFHYVEYMETNALYEVRAALKETPSISDDDLQSLMQSLWPSDSRDLGGYSRGLPKGSDQKEWDDLLSAMRTISTVPTSTASQGPC